MKTRNWKRIPWSNVSKIRDISSIKEFLKARLTPFYGFSASVNDILEGNLENVSHKVTGFDEELPSSTYAGRSISRKDYENDSSDEISNEESVNDGYKYPISWFWSYNFHDFAKFF